MRLFCRTLIFSICTCFLLLIQAGPLLAVTITETGENGTTVTLTVDGEEGLVTMTADCFFPVINGKNEGRCGLQHYHKDHDDWGGNGSNTGNGHVTFTRDYDFGAILSEGEHKFRALSYHKSAAQPYLATKAHRVFIDTTPQLTAEPKETESEVDVIGTLQFEPRANPNAYHGILMIRWLRPNEDPADPNAGVSKGKKFYTPGPINWSWNSLFTPRLVYGSLEQGTHTFIVYAKSVHSIWSEIITLSLNVGNTPKLTADIIPNENGKVDLKGTVQFLSGGNLRIKWQLPPKENEKKGLFNYYGPREFPPSDIPYAVMPWEWSDPELGGNRILDAGLMAQGTHKFIVKAIASNNKATKEETLTLHIENTPELTAKPYETPVGALNIKGTTQFKPVYTPNVHEGILCGKYYFSETKDEEEPVGYDNCITCFSSDCESWHLQMLYEDLVFDPGKEQPGFHVFKFKAQAKNGAKKIEKVPIEVDNKPFLSIDEIIPYKNGKFDIKGRVKFTNVVGYHDGLLEISYSSDYAVIEVSPTQKDIELLSPIGFKSLYNEQGAMINWSLSDLNKGKLLKAKDHPEQIMVIVRALAFNGQETADVKLFTSNFYNTSGNKNKIKGGKDISLSLMSDSGSPLEKVLTSLVSASSGIEQDYSRTGKEGNVSYNVADGSYQVCFDYLGYNYCTNEFASSETTSMEYVIPHRDVTVAAARYYNGDKQPLRNVQVQLWTSDDAKLKSAEKIGKDYTASFSLPEKEYVFKLKYLEQVFASQPQVWTDAEIIIEEGLAQITLEENDIPLAGVPVYVFSEGGVDLEQTALTSPDGKVNFRLPAGNYNFKAEYQQTQYRATGTIVAHQITPLTMKSGGGVFTLMVQDGAGALSGLPCFLYDAGGFYQNQTAVTDSIGMVSFDVGAGEYYVEVEYMGGRFRSDVLTVPGEFSSVLEIERQEVSVTVSSDNGLARDPLQGVRCSLFTETGLDTGVSATTDEQGVARFTVPFGSYVVRADYLGQQFESEPFDWYDSTVTMPLGTVSLHVTDLGTGIVGAKIYIYSESGSYLGVTAVTDGSGAAGFALPAGKYQVLIDYNNTQYWSDVFDVLAYQDNPVTRALDLFAP